LTDNNRFDPVLIIISSAIFAILFMMAYLLFSWISFIAILLGVAVVVYQILSLHGNLASKFKYDITKIL
jgi:hypothetical protein